MISSLFDPYLYTYCSLSTLTTMTEKGTLRFSDIRKSNDTKELVYGFNQIKRRLLALVADDRKLSSCVAEAIACGEAREGEAQGKAEPLSESAFVLCENYNERLYAYFLDNYFDEQDLISEMEFLKICEFIADQFSVIARAMKRERQGKPFEDATAHILTPRCLTLCFTGNGDLLSQWRGYGDDGKGVAVGFYRSDIQDFVSWWDKFEAYRARPPHPSKSVHMRRGAVYYRERDDSFSTITAHQMRHRRFMEERWELTRGSMLRSDEIRSCDMLIFALLEHFLREGIPDDCDTNTRRKTVSTVFRFCMNDVPLYKQPLFYEEEEERLFLWMEGGTEVEGLGDFVGQKAGRRVTNAGFASYLDICAIRNEAKGTDELEAAPEVPIAKVVIGPRCKASEHDIASLFTGHADKPKIARSHVPYDG